MLQFVRNATLLTLLFACGCRVGTKVASYGNLNFVGTGTCSKMFADGNAPNIALTLTDGRNIPTNSITREQVITLFGEPKLSGMVNQRSTKYEEFGNDECTFVFKGGELQSFEVNDGVKIVNLANGKSLTLPAKEAEVRAVFGKPTSVSYPKSQQP